MSKYLRTLFVALLVVSFAVSGAMAAETPMNLFWSSHPDVYVNNEGTGLVSSDGSIMENTDILNFNPKSHTLGEILVDTFPQTTLLESTDEFDLNRLSGYGFHFAGENALPKPFIVLDNVAEQNHIRYMREDYYDVKWELTVDPEVTDMTYAIDTDTGDIDISGLYPYVTTPTDYTFTLTGKVVLTALGQQYYDLSRLEERGLLDVKWTATFTASPDVRPTFGTSSEAYKRLVTQKANTDLGINVISLKSADYKVVISHDNQYNRYLDPGTTYGGRTYVQYNVELHPWFYSNYYYADKWSGEEIELDDPTDDATEVGGALATYVAGLGAAATAEAENVPGTFTYVADKGTYKISFYYNVVENDDNTYTGELIGDDQENSPITVEFVGSDGTPYVVEAVAGDPSTTYTAYPKVYVAFDPADISFDVEDTQLVGEVEIDGLDSLLVVSVDCPNEDEPVTYPNPDAPQYIRGVNIRISSGDEQVVYLCKEPTIYDGFYIPEGLKLTIYAYDTDSADAEVLATIKYGTDLINSTIYDESLSHHWQYVLEFDPDTAPKAGTKSRVIIPYGVEIYDAIAPAADEVGIPFPTKYLLSWDVLFSGDVEEEEEVEPYIEVSGDAAASVLVGESATFAFALENVYSYDVDAPASVDVTPLLTTDGGSLTLQITPNVPGTHTVTVVAYNEANTLSSDAAVTVTATLPGQLTAAFTPATVPVKAGETATSMLEITNTKTGSPAVKEVSPAADWVTYEPRFINGGAFYEFKFAPAATMTAGTHTFTVTVSDDDKTTSAVVTVNVTAAGGDDPTPGPTPSTPAAPTATDLSTFQAALVDNTTTSASVVVIAPSDVTVSSWKVYDNGTEVTDTSKVSIQNNLPNQSARVTVYPDAFDAGDHTLTARYVTTDSLTSNALTLGSFTVADVPVVPVVGKNGGGGCDAGFGALALAAVSLFLLKKRS